MIDWYYISYICKTILNMSEEEMLNCDISYIFELLKVHKKVNTESNNASPNEVSVNKEDEKEIYIDNLIF